MSTQTDFVAAIRSGLESGGEDGAMEAFASVMEAPHPGPDPARHFARWLEDGEGRAAREESLREESARLDTATGAGGGWQWLVFSRHPLSERGPEDDRHLLAWHQDDADDGVLSFLRLADVLRIWVDRVEDGHPSRMPCGKLLRAWLERPRDLRTRRLIVTEERKPPAGADPMLVVRGPAVIALLGQATLEAVSVDGDPVASRLPDQHQQCYRVARPQGGLFPAPRTLDGHATTGALVEALAAWRLTGDERSPLRGDLLRLGHLAYALTGRATFGESEGACLVGGADTPANRARFWRAHLAARYLHLVTDPKTGARIDLVHAEGRPGSLAVLAAPSWWLRQKGPMAWRYSGALFRPATRWGKVERTLAGLEGALTWGPSAGHGRGGRLPDHVRPVRRGGPGTPVFVPWWQVLRLAGEPVGPDDDPKGRHGVRYRTRVNALREAGYFVSSSTSTASAGDTVEIVEHVRGSRARPAGLIVRASARFCAIHAGGGLRTRLPATRLLSLARA